MCVYESGLNADLCVGVCKQVVCAAVYGLGRNDVVAAACDIADGVVDGCGAGCSCQCCCAVFQCCDTLFKYVVGRVHQTGVDVTRFGQTKTACCLCRILEHIRGGRIDRHCSCVSGRVRLFLSHVYLLGFKTIFLICHNPYSFLSCPLPFPAFFGSVSLLWLYYITFHLWCQ